MNTCDTCIKRNICNKICPDIEIILDGLDHSIKSVYKVQFFDPINIEKYFSFFKQNEIIENSKLKLLKKLMLKFFKRLTGKQKKCISLYFGMFGNEVHTQTEIAYILKIKQEAVWKHIYRGKKKLRKLIENVQNRL